MKFEEIRKLDKKTLKARVAQISRDLAAISLKSKLSGLEKPHLKADLKAERSRIETILREGN
ncbi:MAG: hypothetical protein CME61_00155 [Halobacteriovoraceae bacterium]|nr:hypothetical protein [Halobacteriovoraceae bacterium]|tara:strand:+ start:1439 stop:1624 length:186 start_codon:yes stop_codon:yes gene_type:complete